MTSLSQRFSKFSTTRLAVLYDDVGGERSVLVAPALDISEQVVNRIIATTGGLTFVALTPERAAAFMLSPMSRISAGAASSAGVHQFMQYTSVEAREGVSTGISAADRATTIRILGAQTPQPRALIKPGHIFPVETKSGGSLVKAAIPETALDIVTLSGFTDAALFVDLLDTRGEFVGSVAAREWAASHDLAVFSISEVIQHRLRYEPLIERLAEASIPTQAAGEVRAVVYSSRIHDVEHLALIKGTLDTSAAVLVRVQVENTIADVFGGPTPPSRDQIHNSLRALSDRGSGVILYLRKASLGESSAFASAPAPERTHEGSATAGMREYGVGAQILRDMGITHIELLSSTQRTLKGLDSFGITVTSQQAIPEYEEHRKEQAP